MLVLKKYNTEGWPIERAEYDDSAYKTAAFDLVFELQMLAPGERIQIKKVKDAEGS